MNPADDSERPTPPSPSAWTTYIPLDQAYASSLTITYGPRPDQPKPWLEPEDLHDEVLQRIRTNACDPVIHSLLTEDELEEVRLYRAGEEIKIWIKARGEEFHDLLWCADFRSNPEEHQATALRLADHLEDWVCETRFGWGQQRKYVPPEA